MESGLTERIREPNDTVNGTDKSIGWWPRFEPRDVLYDVGPTATL